MSEKRYKPLSQVVAGDIYLGEDEVPRLVIRVENRSKTQTVIFFEGGGSFAASLNLTVEVYRP